ncbi:unnamed protein product [Rotaria sordida]|uniref:G-protein coupled receptors family 1 profile domain-containing protein n=2 Tax=Rotaria sordida TaxID=392033 RepID=A0A818GMA9_9BILA|nr:unnamed protein product [Rotaria sordida]CAF1113912.1 unnamed protein product [Rotaria sordida]CAF3492418.1 unnamed protein product [Rotaria sordida]CAF3735082.1 unnamed protein product [Rotaria sordida]
MSTPLAQAQRVMSSYGLSTFYILGTIGNFLLICILVQRTHRQSSCSLYLLSATVVNFILIQCILPLGIYSADHNDPQNVILIWCKIRSYLFNGLLMLYRWYKMAACIDRAAMCSRHAWIRSFSNVSVAYRAILIITIVWLLIPIHLAVYFRIESGRCVPQSGDYARFFSAYSIIISGWSPPTVMAIFGFMAYKNLKKIRTQVMPQNTTGRINGDYPSNSTRRTINNRLFSKRDQQLILLLICEVMLYICTNLLYSINITYQAITSNDSKSTERIRIESFIAYFSTPFLIIINNCAPFYLYLIVSSKFRQDVKKFITCCHLGPVVQEQNNYPMNAKRTTITNRTL